MRRLNRAQSSWIGTALLLIGSSANADGVHVALVGTTTVVPAQTFEVDLVVPQAGTPFNGYDATISWDPSKLTFLAAAPLSMQEGSYMTGACGQTFHWFQQSAAQVQISHVIWCAGMRLTGPGQLYRLKFRAASTMGRTQVTIAANEFYSGGYTVPTADVSSATVVIANPSDVAGSATVMKLDAAPNPFKPMTTLSLQAPQAGEQSIAVHDVAGRLVRNLDRGYYNAGARQVRWDGRDDHGRQLAAGAYWVTLETEDRKVTKRVVLLR